jgi:signal transduction histidine kinase
VSAPAAGREQAPTRRVLTARAIRVAALAPIVVIGLSVLILGDGSRSDLAGAALLGLVVVVLAGLTTDRLRRLDVEPAPLLPAVIGALGVLVGVVALSLASALAAPRLSVSFGVVIVAAAFALPERQRLPLIAFALAGWAATLFLDGSSDPLELVTQLSGAVALAYVSLLCTSSLEAALAVEREASRASRTRASLLSSVLRLQALEPAAVADAVVRGAREAGFDSALLRVTDGPDLRLVAARPVPGDDPPMRLGPGVGIASIARRTGQPVLVRDYGEHPARLADRPELRGSIAIPITVEGSIGAVLIAGRREAGLTPLQLQAIELLAEEAGVALGRARRFAADASTVAELRRLDDRTHDFVSTVSHELRTPMTVINGLGQTLSRRWDDLSSERRADLLRRIDENAERLAVMVRSLVDTSALDRGQLVARTTRVDLAGCVRSVLGRLGPVMEDHPIHLEVADGMAVEADPSLLEHVVENLLSNAVRHTPPGTKVWVRAGRTGSEIAVEVIDDGPGIPEADLPHVLERFYRAGEPTTRPSGGLGLGLALSQQILRAHDRELTVRSREGRGTAFAFELPAAEEGSDRRH